MEIDILGVDAKLNEGVILDQCKTFLEKNGKVINYQTFDNAYEVEEKKNVDIKTVEHKEEREKELWENGDEGAYINLDYMESLELPAEAYK